MQCDLCLCDKCVIERQLQYDRIAALESTELELREAVKVLATDLRSYIIDQAVGDWGANISDEVACNPIAAAAVREAGR